jgi:hypothetical protein
MTHETIEEAAERDWIYNEHGFEVGYNPQRCINGAIQKPKFINGFIKGAKWQAERMYSEEEVLNLIKKGFYTHYNSLTVEEWFEQFKKQTL